MESGSPVSAVPKCGTHKLFLQLPLQCLGLNSNVTCCEISSLSRGSLLGLPLPVLGHNTAEVGQP